MRHPNFPFFARNFRGYSAMQLDSIIEAGGGLASGQTGDALNHELEYEVQNAQAQAGWLRWEKQSKEASDYAKVARASQRLLKLLGVAPDGKPHLTLKLRGSLLRQGSDWAHRWFRAAECEKRVATVALARESRLRPKTGRPQERPDGGDGKPANLSGSAGAACMADGRSVRPRRVIGSPMAPCDIQQSASTRR